MLKEAALLILAHKDGLNVNGTRRSPTDDNACGRNWELVTKTLAEALNQDKKNMELTQAALLAGTRVVANPSPVHINNLKQMLLELGEHRMSGEVTHREMKSIEKEATHIQNMELEGKRKQALLDLAESVINEKNWKPSDALAHGIQQSDLSDIVREKLRRIEELRTMKINTQSLVDALSKKPSLTDELASTPSLLDDLAKKS